MQSRSMTELSKYRLINELKKQDFILELKDFFNKEHLPDILVRIGQKLGAPTNKVTASMIAKRMAFFGVIHLYAMSVLNQRFIVKIDDIKLAGRAEDRLWLPNFYFEHYFAEDALNDRVKWREEVIQNIFSGFFHPMIEALRRETRFSKLVMWENIAIYIFWLYESLMKDNEYKWIQHQLEDDYRFIVHEAGPELFGPYKHNPLTRFDSEKVIREDLVEPVRVRKTCCLANLLEEKNGKRCSTCPNGCNMPPF